jgi:predicted metal-dependent peptidase
MTILTMPNPTTPSLPEIDHRRLERKFDRTKTSVFLGKTAAFLGPLMCSMDFHWDSSIETACTNGVYVKWNPYFFLRIPVKTRRTVLVHELWHPGLLHMLRIGGRDPLVWNWAADIVINNMLDDEGYSFEGLGFKPWLDHAYDDWTTEAVYDDLIKKNMQQLEELAQQNQWINPVSGKGDPTDIIQPGPGDDKGLQHTIINKVMAAVHAAEIGGGAGNMPGEVHTVLKKFLSPKLPWERLLHNFFNELDNRDYSWSRPSRRYSDMYLPGMIDDRQGLDHLIYYLDVSGSISDGDIIRFHSEFKYVKETFQPEKMTMVQFDTIIQKEEVFLKDDRFEETHVIGRGGTSLVCVWDHIIKHQPTAVVVFSDLQCEPMEPLPQGLNIPMIWVALNNQSAKVPHGQLVHLKE